jgi:hypothetical protein
MTQKTYKIIAFDVDKDVLCNHPIEIKEQDYNLFLKTIKGYEDEYYENDDLLEKGFPLQNDYFEQVKKLFSYN